MCSHTHTYTHTPTHTHTHTHIHTHTHANTCNIVDSNDSLYAGDPKLVNEVSRLFNTVLQQILDHMKSLATSDEVSVQWYIDLDTQTLTHRH